MIWYDKNISLASLQSLNPKTMAAFLDIRWTAIEADSLAASMPVDDRTRQPYGLLHGGASCVLAETVGSVASSLVINREKYYCVGLDINANHIRGKKDGLVTAVARPLHLGGSTHVWDIRLTDESSRLICVSRLTVAILKIRTDQLPPRPESPAG